LLSRPISAGQRPAVAACSFLSPMLWPKKGRQNWPACEKSQVDNWP